MTSPSSTICPFTLRPIADLPHDNTAIVYRSVPSSSQRGRDRAEDGTQPDDDACGHSCTLSELVPYLHDGRGGTAAARRSPVCPVCLACPVGVVCDAEASSFLTRRRLAAVTTTKEGSDATAHDRVSDENDTKTKEGRIVSFRYGAISYHLWVESTSSSQSSLSSNPELDRLAGGTKRNALERIGSVMGMDVHNGLKVIHKGKIIYPANQKTTTESINDASEQLLDISTTDFIHRRKKPSLVVMGTRHTLSTYDSRAVQSTSAIGCRRTLSSVLSAVVISSFPRNLWRNVSCGIRWTWNTASAILGGVCLFVQSVLYPPPRMASDQN
ncbi:hypothetical protein ACHAW6_007132 [Cyclotella cf. meneghiniana]